MRKLTMLLFSLLAFVGVVRAENVAKIGDVGAYLHHFPVIYSEW